MARDYWPCILVDHEGRESSLIFTELQRLDRTYPAAARSGYAVETLVKKLAPPALRKRVRFDPEADMFAAYGEVDALYEIAMLIKRATGQRKPEKYVAMLAPDAARAALRAGFVAGLDAQAQQTFLKGWPRPRDPAHEALERELRARDASTRLAAARRLMRAACRVIGGLHQPLTHPTSFDRAAAALAKETDPKVAGELVAAIAMMCERALPDQRMQPVLTRYLTSPRWQVRRAALFGLGALCRIDLAAIAPLANDPHAGVRAAYERAIPRAADRVNAWAIGEPPLRHITTTRRARPAAARAAGRRRRAS